MSSLKPNNQFYCFQRGVTYIGNFAFTGQFKIRVEWHHIFQKAYFFNDVLMVPN